MLFNAILTLPRKKNHPAPTLGHSLAIHYGQAAEILKAVLAIAVLLAVAAAVSNGMIDMIMFPGNIPYGMSGMAPVNHFIGTGLAPGY